MAEIVRLLHSGFIAYDSSDLEQLREESQTALQRLTNAQSFQINTTDYYDTTITELFNRYIKDPSVLRDFSYREAVIESTFRVFAGKDASRWFAMQTRFTSVSPVHLRYLEETLQYVLMGKRRPVSNLTYRRILSGNTEGFNDVQRQADKQKNAKPPYSTYDKSIQVDLLIYNWTSRLEKFHDLIEFLNVVFGVRTEQNV